MDESVWKLPGLKQLRESPWLNETLRLGHGLYWGSFATREDALRFLRPSRTVTYDNDEIAALSVDVFSRIHLFDWPLLFHLSQLHADKRLTSIVDLGGHVGVKYYAFKAVLRFLDEVAWQVVDVPAICREGERLRPADAAALSFHGALEETAPCDVLICSGVLQYLDFTLEEAIKRLPARPATILLNKVAVSDGEAFYTLESFGSGRMPYHVTTVEWLDTVRERLGYRLAARWDIPERAVEIPSAKGKRPVTMVGEAWSA